jgi:hypothetical protein
MANCEYSTSCFFLTKNLVNMPKTSEYFRNKFCDGDFSACIRFKVLKSDGIDHVPDNLPPVRFKSPKCFCGM